MLYFQNNFFVLKFIHAQKNYMDFYKIFAKEKIFIKSPYYEKK